MTTDSARDMSRPLRRIRAWWRTYRPAGVLAGLPAAVGIAGVFLMTRDFYLWWGIGIGVCVILAAAWPLWTVVAATPVLLVVAFVDGTSGHELSGLLALLVVVAFALGWTIGIIAGLVGRGVHSGWRAVAAQAQS